MKYSLTTAIVGSKFLEDGLIMSQLGNFYRALELEALPSGQLEDAFQGDVSTSFFSKLTDLLAKLPNGFDGQLIFVRQKKDDDERALVTSIFCLEKISKADSYSHLKALLEEAGLRAQSLSKEKWGQLLLSCLGCIQGDNRLPDLVWEKAHVEAEGTTIRALSLTELPQLTWAGCFQAIFEFPTDFVLSLKIHVPDRAKMKRQLETKRRVSHALAIRSSVEVKNIESNSVLGSSEETLERILVGKQTLFEISLAIILTGEKSKTLEKARELEKVIAGIGNAGLFLEGVGTLPVLKTHLPGNDFLSVRKLPILSDNLAHAIPLFQDYSRANDQSSLQLVSRSHEVCHLNLFSKDNLNFNSFICGSSGSGKSFLMNAILSTAIQDEPNLKVSIFDVGGSYRKIVQSQGGSTTSLTIASAQQLLASFVKTTPLTDDGFFKGFIATLCGSGDHITHSHKVAIEELLRESSGQTLSIKKLILQASAKKESFYKDIAHWLKPHLHLDEIAVSESSLELVTAQVSAFDFKELDGDPVLQRCTILLLTDLLWKNLMSGKFPKTLIVFDEVWRFFANSKDFLEEMYRTLRKYKAGVTSITQNLADYGDEAFAKMLFTNSFTKIFLQNGASASYLKSTFDLSDSDMARALSVKSHKPHYSEFFALTSNMSQVFRLYPTQQFYSLANTENITQN